ncbi:MAG: hypothetical protein GXP27_19175 [Planctomycetes bacterium]|nr:hypothetical protein [Planctomycetota bacterium]
MARIARSRKEAASALGITVRTLNNWTKEAWWPKDACEIDARGRRIAWNIDVISAARDAYGAKGSDAAEDARRLRLAIQAEELRQKRLDTELRRLKLATEQGRLIPRQSEELFASTVLTSLSDWADQLPAIIAAIVPARHRAKVRDRLRRELEARRHKLRAELEAHARELDRKVAQVAE